MRSSQITHLQSVITSSPSQGVQLTDNDHQVCRRLKQVCDIVNHNDDIKNEITSMQLFGKYELQWLYGHPDGISFLVDFIIHSILNADYL